MLSIFFRLLIFTLLLFFSDSSDFAHRLPSSILSQCLAIKNSSNLQNLNRRKRLLEACLFKNLTQQFEQTPKAVNNPPPITWSSKGKVSVFVSDLIIWVYLERNRFSLKSSVLATALVSWHDSRLRWDNDEWLIDTMQIYAGSQIWNPEDTRLLSLTSTLNAGGGIHLHLYRPKAEFDFNNVTVRYNGNVIANMTFNQVVDCQFSEYNYPTDVHYCCTRFGRDSSDSVRRYVISDRRKRLVPRTNTVKDYAQTKWLLSKAELVQATVKNAPMQLCFEASRSSAVLKLDLVLPAAACAVLYIISSFFGSSLKTQIYVKMFALLVQVICVRRLIISWFGPFLDQKPRIAVFYEVTFAFTLVNLVVTLVFMGLTKVYRITLTPPYHLQSMAAVVNRWLCFSAQKDAYGDDGDHSPPDVTAAANLPQPTSTAARNYANEWRPIFVALNNVFSIVLVFVYFVTIFII